MVEVIDKVKVRHDLERWSILLRECDERIRTVYDELNVIYGAL